MESEIGKTAHEKMFALSVTIGQLVSLKAAFDRDEQHDYSCLLDGQISLLAMICKELKDSADKEGSVRPPLGVKSDD